MIFRQYEDVYNGNKTETRRVVKEGESEIYNGDKIVAVVGDTYRVKWGVGRDYAVVPKRGQPGLWVMPLGFEIAGLPGPTFSNDFYGDVTFTEKVRSRYGKDWKRIMRHDGWQELRIRITDLRKEPLQDITPESALAEGLRPKIHGALEPGEYSFTTMSMGLASDMETMNEHAAVNGYKFLWESINTRAPHRWGDNPDVWVVKFERFLK